MNLKTPTARFTSAALLLILAVSSFLLSSAVGSLSTPVAIGPGTRLIDIGGNYTDVGTGGRIVVRVLASFGGFPGDTPLSRVNVSIRGSTAPALAALTFHTNSSGTLELTIDPGEYSVAVNDQRFHLSTAVNILPREVTELDVLATRQLHPITFYEAVDRDSSGWLTTWETMTAVTDSGIQPVNKSSPLFLEVLPSRYASPNSGTFTLALPNSTVIVGGQQVRVTFILIPQETRLSLISLDQRGSVVWLALRPIESVKISDGMGLAVALYKPSYGVFTYAVH